MSFSDRLSFVVCPSVCRLSDFFSRTTGLILAKIGTKHSWVKGIQVCSNEGMFPFPRGDQNSKIVKIHKRNLKMYRTTRPTFSKLGTMHPWVKGIQFCLNEAPHHFPRGEIYEIAKIHWRNLKIFFSRSTGLILIKLGTMHPWVKEDSSLFKLRAPPFAKGS